MVRARLAAGAASFLLSSAIWFPAQAAPACWQPYEVEAAMVRNLQTLMMVGALKCGNAGSEMEARYNSFISRHRNMLVNSNNVLKARFMREGGIASGQQAYDGFVTGLANTHSSPAHLDGFCEVSQTVMTLAEQANEPDVVTLARSFAANPAGMGQACGVAVAVAPQPVAPAPQPAATQPAAATSAPAQAQANVEAVQPAQAPQSAAAALEAAAVAMSAAAKALEAQQQAPVVTRVAGDGSENATAPGDLKTEVVEPAPVVAPQPIS